MAERKRETPGAFVRWFRKISQNDDNILRVFDRGDYYWVHGKKDSEYIATEFYRTMESIRCWGPKDKNSKDRIMSINFREQQYKPIMRDYIRRKNNVYEYKRDENTQKWVIVRKETPQTFSMNSMTDASFNLIGIVMSFTKNEKKIGVCLCNHNTFSFEIGQFIEDRQYTKLSHLFVAKGVKQAIFKCAKNSKSNNSEIKKFEQILEKHNIHLMDTSEMKLDTNNERLIVSTISHILSSVSRKKLLTFTPFNAWKLSLSAIAMIVLFEELNREKENFNRYKLANYKCDSFMRLDTNALSALNLFPKEGRNASNNSNTSLYGILNKCKSSMGNRLLSVWIRQPLTDIKEIYRRQKLVKLFVCNTEIREILRDEHMKALIDLEKLNKKLLNNSAKLKDLVELYYFIEKIPFIRMSLEDSEDIEIYHKDKVSALTLLKKEFVSPMQEMEHNFNNYLAMIEQIIDLKAVCRREYIIKSSFDNVLDKYAKKKKKIRAAMDECWNEMFDQLSGVKENQLRLENHKSHGWCFKILKKVEKKVKNKRDKDKYTFFASLKAGTYFMPKNSKLRKHSKDYADCERKFYQRQKIIVDKTVEICRTYLPPINQAIETFSELDVILALAHIGDCGGNYAMPQIYPNNGKSNDGKHIKMSNARHPCLELLQPLDVIANNVELSNGQSTFQIITGPNMGGKSTYIRMIGLIVLMAQMGSYVPCDDCELTIVDSILCRIGAGDNQLRGVSTFMSEMLESSSILECATNNSLIIIDELGRGTSTYDGYGIAYSISQWIIKNINSFCLFATHFHELSVLRDEFPNSVCNKHVNAHFDKESDTLTMLYSIENGVCPQSFGISVAQLAKFPPNVIQTAKKKANELESNQRNKFEAKTYNSIREILKRYRGIVENVKKNNWNQNDKQYIQSINELKSHIETEINKNQELRVIACNRENNESKNDNNSNNKQSDKMEID